MSKAKKIALGTLLVFLVIAGIALGYLYRLMRPSGKGAGSVSLVQTMKDWNEVVSNPRQGFDGRDKITILCMGIDDNWTNSDMVYTNQSRTDTLFLLTLDLASKKLTMLSIPRDTYAHIAGTHWNFKVNAAYQTGGPQRAIDTVDELLGVHADHYMVLNIDATKKIVDALGGVDVDVAHEMHYHDKWGHLSIDLMPGMQHLNGDQAVGFARYRHPDAGHKATAEDGDDKRMARQHILMHAMIERAKSFANVSQAPQLIDVGMSTIRTDLTKTQLFDLAAIFHSIQPDDLQTASLPGDDFRGPKGEWFYRIDPIKAKAYVNWLVKGDENGSRPLIDIMVENGTNVSGLALHAVQQLQEAGFPNARVGGNAPKPTVKLTGTQSDAAPGYPRTELLDTGVPDATAPAQIADVLSVTDAEQTRHPSKPNKLGWTPPPTVTVRLGQDYATLVQQSVPQEPATATQ